MEQDENSRIREIIKHAGGAAAFASDTGLSMAMSRNLAAGLGPSKEIINLIAKTYNIDVVWLETGSGISPFIGEGMSSTKRQTVENPKQAPKSGSSETAIVRSAKEASDLMNEEMSDRLSQPLPVYGADSFGSNVASRIRELVAQHGGFRQFSSEVGISINRLEELTRPTNPSSPSYEEIKVVTLNTGIDANWLLFGGEPGYPIHRPRPLLEYTTAILTFVVSDLFLNSIRDVATIYDGSFGLFDDVSLSHLCIHERDCHTADQEDLDMILSIINQIPKELDDPPLMILLKVEREFEEDLEIRKILSGITDKRITQLTDPAEKHQ